MTPDFHGVKAAPNRCEIKAKVLNMKQNINFPDKWDMELEILETKSLSGPNFTHRGDKIKGFTFESTPNFSPQSISLGSIIIAQAEFLGDERSGKFLLHKIITIR